MSITIKYFGKLAELTGVEEEQLEMTAAATVRSVIENIETRYDKILNSQYRVAVNLELVDDEQEVHDNDEVALLPPFAGG